MKNKKVYLIGALLSFFSLLYAENVSYITPLKGERWWGGFVGIGDKMPYNADTKLMDLSMEYKGNQWASLLLSSEGRYVWSEYPFKFQFRQDTLIIISQYEKVEAVKVGNTLKDATLGACKAHYPYKEQLPAENFFALPQYNTWIELAYNQNQKDIQNYANNVLNGGFPPGIFIIDDNWQKYYGNLDFKEDKFPDPKGMVAELHHSGFRVMLWICPYVSPDSSEFRELEKKDYLLKTKDGKIAIEKWWNGYSATYDLTNPQVMDYLESRLRNMMKKYDVDGFKFDAGWLSGNDYSFFDKKADKNIFSQRWAELGAKFEYNELRIAWKVNGEPLIQRLLDKDYSWDAINLLIPHMAVAGLMGYAYSCPDMIGGGMYSTFKDIDSRNFDQELIVRSCQVAALMPMMQFSVAPWRILNKENTEICASFAHLHQKMGQYILSCARHTMKTYEPILRHMEYEFPHQGFSECKTQFMLGDRYLVAPMLEKGVRRTVRLPKGVWKDDQGRIIRGGGKPIVIDVPLERLPYYERIRFEND